MGLGSVMQTALSGMNAAAASVQVTANNVANAQTPGFKAVRVRLATQVPQTLSQGAPPGAGGAGGNPIQIGSGVSVVGTDVDWSQGQIVIEEQPALLALEGEGFFILEGNGGERVYTRDGGFALNANGELVTARGERVLGYRVDEQGQLRTGELFPLTVHLGSQVAGEDGQAATLQRYSIGRNGRVTGHYSDGRNRTLGQIRLARFRNPQGLAQQAGNTLRAAPAAGAPIESAPGEGGVAEIIGGAIEQSNVDLGRELIDLTLAGNQFQANLAVLQTADTLLGEMFFPWRR